MPDEAAGITDEIIVVVKGPDPAVWGEEHAAGIPVEEVSTELPEGVKGPDPAIWG